MTVEVLRSLFLQKAGMRSRFEIQKAAEWESLQKNLEAQIDQNIVTLRNSKELSIAELGRMMKTSDFRTAQNRIKAAFDRVTKRTSAAPIAASEETYIWSLVDPEDNLWDVADGQGNSARIAILQDEKATVVLSGDPEVSAVFSSSPEMGFLLWQKQTTTGE